MSASHSTHGNVAPYYYVPADSAHPVCASVALLVVMLGALELPKPQEDTQASHDSQQHQREHDSLIGYRWRHVCDNSCFGWRASCESW